LVVLGIVLFRSLLYTLSRGSYLAFFPVLIALSFFAKKSKVFLIWGIFAITVLVFAFMPQMVYQRISGTVRMEEDVYGKSYVWEESPRARIDSWKSAIFDWLPSSPFFGFGVSTIFIDSQAFLTLVEVGIIGFMLFCWVLVRLFFMVKEVLNMKLVQSDDFAMGITSGFMAGYIGLLFHSIGSNTFIIIRVMEPFWFMAAIVLSLPELLVKQRTEAGGSLTG